MARFYRLETTRAPGGPACAAEVAEPEEVARPAIGQTDVGQRRIGHTTITPPDTSKPQRRAQDYRPKSTQLPQLSEPCIRCGFDFLMPSQPRGTREEFLDVVGIPYYRCHNCEARYARVGRRNIGGRPRKERTHVWALLAILTGLLSCTALALYIQKLAHRWPF